MQHRSEVNPSVIERVPTEHSTATAARRSGATTRQLGTWVAKGYLTPAQKGVGSGNPHRWSDADVDLARRIVTRLAHGYTVAGAFRAEAEAEAEEA